MSIYLFMVQAALTISLTHWEIIQAGPYMTDNNSYFPFSLNCLPQLRKINFKGFLYLLGSVFKPSLSK